MKTSLIHMKVRNSIKGNLKVASAAVYKSIKKPDFIAIPEYFSVPNNKK